MKPMDELKDCGYDIISVNTIVYWKQSGDKSGALEIALLPKMYPCTKEKNVYITTSESMCD